MTQDELWEKVHEVFADRIEGAVGVMQRLGDDWTARYKIPRHIVDAPNVVLSVGEWSQAEVRAVLAEVSQDEPRIITRDKPRYAGTYGVVLDYGAGLLGPVDGRRRMNRVAREGGTFRFIRIRWEA